jgi:hypothetical protein
MDGSRGSLADTELGVSIKVSAPSGEMLVAQTAPAKTGTPLWADLPVTFDIFGEFPLRLPEYGTYVVEVEITDPNEDRAKGQANFYVRKPA